MNRKYFKFVLCSCEYTMMFVFENVSLQDQNVIPYDEQGKMFGLFSIANILNIRTTPIILENG